jgi:hypothetical protein
MDEIPPPLSPVELGRVGALLDRFGQNFDGLQQSVTLVGMELSLVSPGADGGGAEALRVLRAMRAHMKDGYEIHVQLLRDLDQVVAIVEGTSPSQA